jgi:hypothetical protein
VPNENAFAVAFQQKASLVRQFDHQSMISPPRLD